MNFLTPFAIATLASASEVATSDHINSGGRLLRSILPEAHWTKDLWKDDVHPYKLNACTLKSQTSLTGLFFRIENYSIACEEQKYRYACPRQGEIVFGSGPHSELPPEVLEQYPKGNDCQGSIKAFGFHEPRTADGAIVEICKVLPTQNGRNWSTDLWKDQNDNSNACTLKSKTSGSGLLFRIEDYEINGQERQYRYACPSSVTEGAIVEGSGPLSDLPALVTEGYPNNGNCKAAITAFHFGAQENVDDAIREICKKL